eukprot:TRINITY_DN35525_c0_g1_i1.p1 TRINITY_DN35525_c0_g1~~TRINITY_DN35525_c0_g1_i1.p1  ORF type:complete len:1432 (-),score=477.17 TRINITY_DN35525_c0_g1_i1:154-3870(-)
MAAPFRLPADTFDRLYPYQRVGVAWMARLLQKGHGGVLADEMGLGKTIQVCGLLNGARKAGATHALLLMPITLLDQWAKEARIWCPGWPVYTYYGTAAQRAKALRAIRRPMGGILLTSYSLISNTDDLLEVFVEDRPEPKRRGGRKPGDKGAKRRKTDDDDGLGEEEESDEEPVEPELPAGDLPELGKIRPWDLVVCDEAHRMKNISTLLGKSLRRLKSRSRILLTGTPVQNALQDLWAIMDFAQPGLLGNHATFVKTFSDPIDRGSVRGAKAWAVELKRHLSEQMRALISPHLLRRTKLGAGLMEDGNGSAAEDVSMEDDTSQCGGAIDVKRLPPKKETIVWLYPSEDQKTVYKKVLENSEIIREASSKAKLGIEVFQAIGLLKRLCNHPLLLLPSKEKTMWKDLLTEVQTGSSASSASASAEPSASASAEPSGEAAVADASTPTKAPVADASTPSASTPVEASGLPDDELVISEVPDSDATAPDQRGDATAGATVETMLQALSTDKQSVLEQSAKLRCLEKLIPELSARGHRTLVFSQSVKMLDLVQICCLKPNGLRCLRIDGQTDAQARAEKVNKFNKQTERFQCMLLTTNVGGVGLNLTSADRVILVDPAWNPAIDAQAVDRAFRIGQTKEVRVYRLIMSGLIEDKMFRLQVFKMGMAKTALETNQQHAYFTAREIKALFDWTDPAMGETRQLLLDKHGEDAENSVKGAALEDGSEQPLREGSGEGWFKAGPAVGISDFSCLLGTQSVQDEDQDEEFAAQVKEAKEKLEAADLLLQQRQKAREQAEANQEQNKKDLEECNAKLEELKERSVQALAALKEKRGDLQQASKSEMAAQQKVVKVTKAKSSAQDALQKAKSTHDSANEVTEGSAKASSDAQQGVRSAEEAFQKVLQEAASQLAIVDESGRCVGTNPADVPVARLRGAQKALKSLNLIIETASTRQAEFESLEEQFAQADQGLAEAEANVAKIGDPDSEEKHDAELAMRSKEKERAKLEQLEGKARQQAEATREKVLHAIQHFVEAGMTFADHLKKTEARQVKQDQVKATQTAVKAAMRPLAKHWTNVIAARQAQSRATNQRRKASAKAFSFLSSKVDAEVALSAAEQELAEAMKEEAHAVEQRKTRESELGQAEAAKSSAEAEEAEMKKRRDELKAAQPEVKKALQAAQKAEKEANSGRQALHNLSNKRQQEKLQLEEMKNSAVSNLKNEEYNASQVDQAYAVVKKAKKAAQADSNAN